MKKILFTIFLFSVMQANGQMQQTTYISTYQIDKTYDGSKKNSNYIATITIVDPKSITNRNSDFENLPEGKLLIKYSHLKNPLKYVIKYFGEYAQDKSQCLYGISNSPTDYNSVIIMKNNSSSIQTKGYKFIILTVNMNSENGALSTYTAYYCNLKNLQK